MNDCITNNDAAGAVAIALDSCNPFTLLGIAPGEVNAAVLKKNYRKLSAMLHPDKCSHESAETAFKNISNAKVPKFLNSIKCAEILVKPPHT